MQLQRSLVLRFLFIVSCLAICLADTEETEENAVEEQKVDPEKLDYAKGSVCGYCDYCKFCKLCDEDCPCETGPSKPNCHMCKYCKFCYLCSAVCDTICQPGGILDKMSSAMVNALPSALPNKEDVDSDIEGVKTWIEKKKDEL